MRAYGQRKRIEKVSARDLRSCESGDGNFRGIIDIYLACRREPGLIKRSYTVLALGEVPAITYPAGGLGHIFGGEILSARVRYLEIRYIGIRVICGKTHHLATHYFR